MKKLTLIIFAFCLLPFALKAQIEDRIYYDMLVPIEADSLRSTGQPLGKYMVTDGNGHITYSNGPDISGIATNAASIAAHIANDQDTDPNNEIQDLSILGNTLSLTGDASTVDLSKYQQTLVTTGLAGNISISDGNDININVNDHSNRTALDLVSGTNTGDQDISGIATNAGNISTLQTTKQDVISLTTTGSSGAATFLSNTLNIPRYDTYADNAIDNAGFSGTGTANYLTMFGAGGSSIVNSPVYSNGTNVGIGTTTPTDKLQVNGSASIGSIRPLLLNPATSSGGTIKNDATFGMYLRTYAGSTDNFSILTPTGSYIMHTPTGTSNVVFEGKVGIGTTTPATKLDVNGGARVSTAPTTSTDVVRYADLTTGGVFDLGEYLLSTDFTNHPVYSIANGTGFLKNNGSGVWSYDNNSYATTSQLSEYLPLSGGTLTGSLIVANSHIVSSTSTAYTSYRISGVSQLGLYATASLSWLTSPTNTFKIQVGGSDAITVSTSQGLQLPAYSGTAKTGTVTYLLGTDASGNVLKTTNNSSFSGAKAYKTGTQTFSAGTTTQITFAAEDYDPENKFTSNTYTAPANGYYRASISIRVTTTGTNATNITLTFGGSVTNKMAYTWSNQNILQEVFSATEVFYMTTGQTINTNINTNQTTQSANAVFSIEKL